MSTPSIPLDAVIMEAILTADTTLLQDCIAAASKECLDRAMLYALHGGSAQCVKCLIPYCDLDATIGYVEWRNRGSNPKVEVEPEFLSMLLAVRGIRDARVLLEAGLVHSGVAAESRQRGRL
jgi:hypothetical protein